MDTDRKLYLPYLLSALGRASFQGTLSLMEGDVVRTIFFHNGKAVSVVSRLQEETLGRLLLDEGKITADDYSRLLEMMMQAGRPAGEVLISMGLMGPQEIYLALEFQTRKKLINCFRMMDFGFTLEPKPVPAEAMITSLDPGELIFTGILEGYNVDRLLSEFPVDEETHFTSRKPPKDGPPIKMGTMENKLYRAIGSGATLANLMGVCDDLQVLLSILYSLHALDLADVEDLERPSTDDLDLPNLKPEPKDAPAPVVEKAPEPEREVEEFSSPQTLDDALQANGISNPRLAQKVIMLGKANHFEVLEVDMGARGTGLKNAFYRLLRTFCLQDLDQAYTSPKERVLARRLLEQATIAYRVLDNDESRNAYVKALEANKMPAEHSDDPRLKSEVLAQKGELALTAKRYDEAVTLFQEALQIYPDEPTYYFKLGIISYAKSLAEVAADRPLPEAVRMPFMKAVAMNPRYDEARLYLGYIAKRNGDLKRALKEFEGAVECNPNNTRAQSEIRLLKRRMAQKKK